MLHVTKYDQHIEGRLLTSSIFILVMTVKNHRRRKFQAYQAGQQAVTKLAAVILEGVENPSNVVVAWGNGSFGPTSRDFNAAMNILAVFKYQVQHQTSSELPKYLRKTPETHL